MLNKFRKILVSGIGVLAVVGQPNAAENIEQPTYEVISRSNGVELRRYAPHLVAEVTVEANSLSEASSKGFRQLAGYIFGDNKGANKIEMTAPVTTQAKQKGTKIAMTTPVATSKDSSGSYTIRFTMPSKWTMETLPTPNNLRVKLTQTVEEKRVAYRFVGDRSQASIINGTVKIDTFLKAENLEQSSPVIVAGYDGPSVPADKKRWEVMRIVK